MINALEELEDLEDRAKSLIKWIRVWFGEDSKIVLDGNLSWGAMRSALDREYDNGFGGQELFGTVWFEDGSWAERGEYDGSEWWERRTVPPLPKEALL